MKKRYMKPEAVVCGVELTAMMAVSNPRISVNNTVVNDIVGDVNRQEFTDIWGN